MNPIVILPVSRPDFHLAVKLLRWLNRLKAIATPDDSYRLVIWGTQALSDGNWSDLADAAGNLKAWIERAPELFEQGYAASANYMFRTALEFVEREYPHHPILWCEADCTPTRPSWYREIAQEYAACGKPFLGDFIEYPPTTPGAINHLTGNAVYPANWRELAPSIALLPGPDPMCGFDSQCAHEIFPQAARSKTIQQIWRPPSATDGWVAKHIRPTTALFHQCKDGSVIDVLTRRAGEQPIPLAPALCPSTYPQHIQSLAVPHRAPVVEILIVTFARDIPFLHYCLKSIRQYCAGFAGVTLVVPEHERGLYDWVRGGVKVRYFEEPAGKGMMAHELQICRADEWCPNAEYIVHLDADCMFFRKTTPAAYVQEDRCLTVCEPYSRIKNPNRHLWRKCVEEACGISPDADYMVRHPNVHPRAVYGVARAAVERHTGKSFADYVLSCRSEWPQSFAEFPLLGTIGMDGFASQYNVVEYDHEADAALCGQPAGSFQYLYKRDREHMVEFWSHGGLHRYKADCDAVLGGRIAAYYVK